MTLIKSVANIIDRIKESAKREPERYLTHSLGKVVALLTFIFYFTWYVDILTAIWSLFCFKIPAFPLFVMTLTFLNAIIQTAYNLIMIPIYKYKIAFFQQYRVDSNERWPWERNYSEWKIKCWKTVKNIFLNVFLWGSILTVVANLYSFNFILTTENIPSTWTHIWQFFIFFVIEEIGFFFVHKLFHDPRFYWIHKQHHQYNTTVTIAAEYSHPIEYLLMNSITFGLGFKLVSKFMPVHIFTIIIWMTFRIIETCNNHCGYEWSWTQSTLLPFSCGGKYHSFHHTQNAGNFGSMLSIFDTVFDSNKEYYKNHQKKQ